MVGERSSRAWERYAWFAGVVFVVAVVAESVVSGGLNLNQNDSAVKIANGLYHHRKLLLVVTCLSVVYTPMFLIYLTRLHDLLRGAAVRSRFRASLVLTGGLVFVVLHAVSDVGITGLAAAKIASFGAQHDPGVSYALDLLTFAIDSVGDVFGSLFALAAGWLVIESRVLPRWLGSIALLAAPFLFLQAFGLGGVIASFGLVLDLIGFLLLLIFVLVSSIILLMREEPAPSSMAGIA